MKSFIKRLFKEKHWQFLSWHRSRFGTWPSIWNYLVMFANGGLAKLSSPLVRQAVFIRPGTADQDVFHEILLAHEYDLDFGDPKVIIDAGAHIGIAAAYFASRYPRALVVALEPERCNFEMLLLNTRKYPNIKPIQAGLWSHHTVLRTRNDNVATWSFRVEEDPTGTGFPAIGIVDLMREHRLEQIDVLKMDIEGSEIEVLGSSATWLSAVSNMIIEIHDRFRPGCSTALASALDGYTYDKSVAGEKIAITHLKKV